MIRDITVHPVLNGFVCTVGCQIVVFNSVEQVAHSMIDYYRDPAATEKRFKDQAVNKTIECNLGPEPCPPPPQGIAQTARLRDDINRARNIVQDSCACETTSPSQEARR